MNRILTAAALVAMAALSTARALAATTTVAKPAAKTAVAKPATPAKPTVVTFKMIDANHDGKISFAELKKYWPSLTKAQFAKFAGKDGFMTRAELAAFAK